MDTSTVLVLVGVAVLILIVVITVVVLLLQKGGSGRRITPGQSSASHERHANSGSGHRITAGQPTPSSSRGQRRGAYVPPAPAPAILPPTQPTPPGTTNLPPRSTRWASGGSSVAPPEVIRRPTVSAEPSLVSAAHRLTQEATKLRSNGYNMVTLARRPDIEEYCLLVRVARSDGKNISIHLICQRNYPSSPPHLIATIETDTFDSHGEIEIVEQRLALESPVLRAWGPASSVFAVVNNVLSTLPLAAPDNSPPTVEPIFARYTDVIA